MQPKTKKAIKDLHNHLKSNTSGLLAVLDDPTQKKFKKTILEGYDADVFSTLTVPQEEWANTVFTPMYFGFKPNYVTVNMPHMCMMEARAVFDGSCYIAGIPYENVAGRD
eukprot:5607536-Heterocapsa_arctica.AAC.1